MHQDKAIGMFMGLFIGDALGAPLEFIRPHEMTHTLTEMEGGGVHNTAEGEWTDDGAMAVAIADAYISKGGFAPSEIAANFKMWKKTGHFGTRNYVFDIGRTCSTSIDAMTTDRPYMGSTDFYASGNGTIMRLAPIMLANHNDVGLAIAESVAVSLMTHGTHNIVQCTAGFVSECMAGTKFLNYNRIRNYNTRNGERTVNTIMHAYAQAWDSVDLSHSFEDAVVHAVNLGYDADTVGAVTGVLAGRMYGYSNIPKRWLKVLVKHDELLEMAHKLYALGGDDGKE
jgi:ADP-ribosyl-[dinitrogen reductase] hydrolase